MHLGVQPSRRITIQLGTGVIGYLTGAVAWSLFWLAIALTGNRHWTFLRYLGFPLSALSLILVGVSCFVLRELYDKWLAIITGVAYIITAVPFFMMNSVLTHEVYRWGHSPLLIIVAGYGLLIVCLLLWSAVVWDLAELSRHTRLAAATAVLTIIAACIFPLILPLTVLWGPNYPTLFTQPYVIAQILSAILLYEISSDTRQKP